jgi:hypothetical protein
VAGIVINEFEVIAAPEKAPEKAEAPEKPAPGGVTAQDVERIVARTRARGARLRAH